MSAQKVEDEVCTFTPFLKKKGVAFLDGGMTTSLPEGSGNHFLWGKQLLFTKAGMEEVYKVHYDFLEAGSDAVETLTYKMSDELMKITHEKGWMDKFRDETETAGPPGNWLVTGIDPKTNLPTMAEIYERAVGVAAKARDDYVKKVSPDVNPLVIGAFGPYDDACKVFSGQTDPITSSRKQSILAIEKSRTVRKLTDDQVQGMHEYYRNKLTGMCLKSKLKPDMVNFETLPSAKEALIAIEELDAVNTTLGRIIPCNITWIPHPVFGPDKINKGDHLADAVVEVIKFVHGEGQNTGKLAQLLEEEVEDNKAAG